MLFPVSVLAVTETNNQDLDSAKKEESKEKEPIPPTVDNIIFYITALVISATALIEIKLFTKNKKEN